MAASASAFHALLLSILACSDAVGTSMTLRRRSVQEKAKINHKGGGHQKTKVIHKTAYFGKVEIGSMKQAFQVVFDSGSGNLLVPASDCSSEACLEHARYDEAKSTSAERVRCDGVLQNSDSKPQDEVTILFGTGEIWGRCVQDQICLGNVCYQGSFIAATYESKSPFTAFNFDGVLGLALPTMSQGSGFNVMENLKQTHKLQQTIYSVFLSNSDSEVSEITFGSAKTSHMASDLHWVPVSRDTGYWEVKITDITIDNHPQELCANCFVAVDTGTSELAGPSSVISALAERLRVLTDCSNYHQLPRLGFLIGGHILNLEPKDYVDQSSEGCQVSLMPLNVPPPKGPLFVFGIPFLEKFYTVYDNVNKQVGFAVAKHVGEGPERAAAVMSQLGATIVNGTEDHARRSFLDKRRR